MSWASGEGGLGAGLQMEKPVALMYQGGFIGCYDAWDVLACKYRPVRGPESDSHQV